jgi:hypothetical protein
MSNAQEYLCLRLAWLILQPSPRLHLKQPRLFPMRSILDFSMGAHREILFIVPFIKPVIRVI